MPICTVTGTLTKLDETPISGQQVYATIKSTEQDQGGQTAGATGVSSDTIEAFTGDDGVFAVDVLQGAIVLLEIPAINLRKEIEIPAEATIDFTALI